MLAERCPQSRCRMDECSNGECCWPTSSSSPSSSSSISTRIGTFTNGDETSVRHPVSQSSSHCQNDYRLRRYSSSTVSSQTTRKPNSKLSNGTIYYYIYLYITSFHFRQKGIEERILYNKNKETIIQQPTRETHQRGRICHPFTDVVIMSTRGNS